MNAVLTLLGIIIMMPNGMLLYMREHRALFPQFKLPPLTT